MPTTWELSTVIAWQRDAALSDREAAREGDKSRGRSARIRKGMTMRCIVKDEISLP